MSVPRVVPVPPSPGPSRPASSGRRVGAGRNRRLVALALAMLLAGAGLGAWWWTGDRAAAAVEVGWQPSCTTGVHAYGSRRAEGNEEWRGHPVIESRPGGRCVLEVRIRNGSDREVQVTGLITPFAGPDTGGEWAAAPSDDLPDVDGLGLGPGSELDARLPADVSLPPGEEVVLDLGLVRSERGCNDAGTWLVDDWPGVEVEVLGRDHEASGSQPWLVATTSGPCRRR